MKRPKTLTAAFVRNVKARGRFGDGRGGHGLSLLVQKTKSDRWSKTWSQRLRIGGKKPVSIGLGSYPAVTLSEARDRALRNARAVQEGRDPRGPGVPSFHEAAARTIDLQSQAWTGNKTEALWRNTLATYAAPIAERRIDTIQVADVLTVILPIWHDKPELARKFRQMLSAVFKYSIAHGWRQDDPAHAVGAILPKQNGKTVKHREAVPHAKAADALAKVRGVTAVATAKLALEWIMLTACRSGEARGATWDEIDLEAGVWVVPAERMKGGKEWRVPLSAAALDVLERAAAHRDASGLIFPSVRGRVMTDKVLSGLLKDAKVAATVHGFRTSFRTWAGDTGEERELAELSLAHCIGNSVEQAYARTDLLERRRGLMERWAGYIC